MPTKVIFFSGLCAGIKFFLTDFIFKRCPRLRAKYDTPYIIWTSLLTDLQLKERSNATVSRRVRLINLFVLLFPTSENQIPFSLRLKFCQIDQRFSTTVLDLMTLACLPGKDAQDCIICFQISLKTLTWSQ